MNGVCAIQRTLTPVYFQKILVSRRDGAKDTLPDVRCPEFQTAGSWVEGAISGVAVLSPAGEKNRAFAIGEEAWAEVLGRDADNVGMLTQRPIIELGKISDAALGAGADCGGPENAVLAKLQIAIPTRSEKPLNILVRHTRKEEYLVKIPLPCKFGLALREAGVLYQFAEGERAQRHNRDSGVCGEGFQGIGGCGQSLCHGNAGEAAKADSRCLLRL